jgi:CHAT domain-containing protein/tetratricopeptide (TPR) repeat protein
MILKKGTGYFLSVYLIFIIISDAIAKDTGTITNMFPNSRDIHWSQELEKTDDNTQLLEKLNADFQSSIITGDTERSQITLNYILKILEEEDSENLTISNSMYYTGVYYLLSGKISDAIIWLKLSLTMREKMMPFDEIHAKCLFNLGIAYSKLGDFRQMEIYTLRSLEIERNLLGEDNPLLISGLSALVNAYFGLNEYDKAILYGNKALGLIGNSIEDHSSDIAILYSNIGACHAKLSDYSKAVLYLEKAESLYKEFSVREDEYYINLLNSLAITYFFLGHYQKADEYFNKGIEKIGSSNSALSLNFLNSAAIVLANAGKVRKGEELILNSLSRAKEYFGPESRDYFEVLKNYAEYLSTFKIDVEKSLFLYEQCIGYLDRHDEDFSLKEPVFLGYALALTENGESVKALETIQKLLFPGIEPDSKYPVYENPPGIDLVEPVQWSINVLKAKYRILWDIYIENQKNEYLMVASETSELIISLIEKVRINISEEDSRLVLGDRFREFYLYTIRDLDLCYKNTGDEAFLEKAFEYAEKSKVAGLLASTRELKATQFHIPENIAELERRLKKEIGFYEAKISEENYQRSPDHSLISEWKNLLLGASMKRDSLVNLFEQEYPDYYSIKYNTEVIDPEKIPDITGRNTNYLNYLVSDTVLYIFLSNRKTSRLLTISIDSAFFDDIREFRKLLSMPVGNAKSDILSYCSTGNRLYEVIIEPVREYLISDRLLISPDNILSYIPFEVFPVHCVTDENKLFSQIPYLMKDFNISYTYSATFLAESLQKDYGFTNKLIAFAPVYAGRTSYDSLLPGRQTGISTLYDLPFARMEADYVTNITNGKLLINRGASENAFKSEASKYDIIHLSMHTILNDADPMYSKMLFYQGNDNQEDGNLNTYEVYGLPLKAKMVTLSSCNTGTGKLHNGEGILSLARGFIYSGSQSVVMSLWEVEDRSGAEIVKNYYKYLKKGAAKSNALRRARIRYLKQSDMLRSHPYFWSSLVIYGSNDPLYYSCRFMIIAAIVGFVAIIVSFIFYFKSR